MKFIDVTLFQSIDPTLCTHWQDSKVTQLVITSGDQLQYLIQQIPKQYLHWLKQLTLYIPSQRIGQQAEKFGFSHIINTRSAANPILLDYLLWEIDHRTTT